MQRTYVRRRRTLAAAALLAVTLLVGSPVARAFGGPDAAETQASTYVVRTGDTLWAIAERAAPDRDPREIVHAIVEANDLGDAPLIPGQSLAVPDVG